MCIIKTYTYYIINIRLLLLILPTPRNKLPLGTKNQGPSEWGFQKFQPKGRASLIFVLVAVLQVTISHLVCGSHWDGGIPRYYKDSFQLLILGWNFSMKTWIQMIQMYPFQAPKCLHSLSQPGRSHLLHAKSIFEASTIMFICHRKQRNNKNLWVSK